MIEHTFGDKTRAGSWYSNSLLGHFVCAFVCVAGFAAGAVSERIMKFAQCPADVSQLEMVRQCRDQRAKLRAEGLRLIRALVEAAASPPAKVTVVATETSVSLRGFD